jgi:hypothetical protein
VNGLSTQKGGWIRNGRAAHEQSMPLSGLALTVKGQKQQRS